VFQGDVVVAINIVSAPLVQEIVSPVLDLLVDPGNPDPLFPAVPAAVHGPGEFSLSTAEPFRGLLDVVRVWEDRAVRVGGEVLQVQVDPDRPGTGRRLRGVRGLGDDRHEPLVGRGMLDHDLLDLARHRTTELDPHFPDLAQPETGARELEPGLLVDHGVDPLLPQFADLSPLCFQSPQSNQVVDDLLNHVLQHFAVDLFQLGVLFLQLRQTGVPIDSVLKTPVPDKGTPRKAVEQPPCNLLRGVDPVPGDVAHEELHRIMGSHPSIRYLVQGESEQTKGCNSSPRLKPGAFLHPLNPGSVKIAQVRTQRPQESVP